MGYKRKSRTMCGNCTTRLVNRPYGLCNACHSDWLVREKFQAESRAHKSVQDFYGRSKVKVEPTNAIPGSWEKMEVLAYRASVGAELFHPLDRPFNWRRENAFFLEMLGRVNQEDADE